MVADVHHAAVVAEERGMDQKLSGETKANELRRNTVERQENKTGQQMKHKANESLRRKGVEPEHDKTTKQDRTK
jgi:hypothetical protein